MTWSCVTIVFDVVRHHRIRRLNWRWPSKARRQRWAITPKRRYPGLSAQSAQQIIGEFCEAVDSCSQLRRNGHAAARYPWRLRRYHDVVYTNQDARRRDGRLVLPHCQDASSAKCLMSHDLKNPPSEWIWA